MKLKLKVEVTIEVPTETVGFHNPYLQLPETVDCAVLGHGTVKCKVHSVETTNWLQPANDTYYPESFR